MTGHFLRCSPPGSTIRPRLASPRIRTFFSFFFPTGCTIGSLVSGLGSGGRELHGAVKSGPSPPRIMPLFQLLWPGMPDFTGRYSSLCVNQSFARDPLGSTPHPPNPHQPSPVRAIPPAAAIPLKPDPTSSFRARTPHPPPASPASRRGGGEFAQLDRALIDSSNQATVSVLKLTNKQTADHLDSIRVREAQLLRDKHETTQQLQLLAPEFVSSLWRRCKS